MIRAIIFDIGNVLLKFDFNIAIRKLAPLCDVQPDASLLAPIEEIKIALESGRMGREEFVEKAISLLRYRGTPESFVAAWEDIFELNQPMIDLVEQLHSRYPLYLLSNTSDIHMDYVLANYPAFGRFTDAVYSYKVKCFKPDPAIYEVAVRQFGVNPSETVFIDDLPANIESARSLGLHAIAYDFRQHDALLKRLSELGVC